MARSKESKTKKPTELSPCFVPCRIEPGMFREEFLVYLEATSPHNPKGLVKAQLLVDKREVSAVRGTPSRHDPASGWLRVTLIRQQGEWAEVVLPQPSQPFGERVLVAGDSVQEEVTMASHDCRFSLEG